MDPKQCKRASKAKQPKQAIKANGATNQIKQAKRSSRSPRAALLERSALEVPPSQPFYGLRRPCNERQHRLAAELPSSVFVRAYANTLGLITLLSRVEAAPHPRRGRRHRVTLPDGRLSNGEEAKNARASPRSLSRLCLPKAGREDLVIPRHTSPECVRVSTPLPPQPKQHHKQPY